MSSIRGNKQENLHFMEFKYNFRCQFIGDILMSRFHRGSMELRLVCE